MVGVAASAVMLVLPYYLHNAKAFGKITILGEFVAVARDLALAEHTGASIHFRSLSTAKAARRPPRKMNRTGCILFLSDLVLGGMARVVSRAGFQTRGYHAPREAWACRAQFHMATTSVATAPGFCANSAPCPVAIILGKCPRTGFKFRPS